MVLLLSRSSWTILYRILIKVASSRQNDLSYIEVSRSVTWIEIHLRFRYLNISVLFFWLMFNCLSTPITRFLQFFHRNYIKAKFPEWKVVRWQSLQGQAAMFPYFCLLWIKLSSNKTKFCFLLLFHINCNNIFCCLLCKSFMCSFSLLTVMITLI